MNRESFGKKCKCGHFESEHVPKKAIFSVPSASPDIGILFPHPPSFDGSKRGNCKICECEIFDP